MVVERQRRVEGLVERVDGRMLRYDEFVERYLKLNVPVVLTGLMDHRSSSSPWPACSDWVHNSTNNNDTERSQDFSPSSPNLPFFSSNFPSALVPVVNCSDRDDQRRTEMSMHEFVSYWQHRPIFLPSSSNNDPQRFHSTSHLLLYLKDWHFVKEYPHYVAYSTPKFFSDDWLNLYLDTHPLHRDSDISKHNNEVNCADYRFVYMGPKGTWTPLHADVFRSYSWSANVCGRKLWLFSPPSQTPLLLDRNLKESVYDVNEDVSELHFPGFKKTIWWECIQEQNEIIFVPSGWYHQVHNLEDTISINHNWFNAHNLSWVYNLLLEDYTVAKDYIEDIRDITDDFEGLCQRNLAANSGMNFYDFFILVTRFALTSIIELLHNRSVGNYAFSKADHQFIYNVISIRSVACCMKSLEAFKSDNVYRISDENRRAFSDVKKILEEECFRELSASVVKTYRYIYDGQELHHEMGNYEKHCLSITCRRSKCDIVYKIVSYVSSINGPEDLVRLIDCVLWNSSSCTATS